MAGLQRTSPRLKARVSPYHSGVTLYGMDTPGPSTSSPKKRAKLEPSTPEPLKEGISSRKPSKSPQKSKTPYKKALATPHPAPERWREVYDTIKEMRSQTVAPVDTMGCHTAQQHETDPKVAATLYFSLPPFLIQESRTNDLSRWSRSCCRRRPKTR